MQVHRCTHAGGDQRITSRCVSFLEPMGVSGLELRLSVYRASAFFIG